MLIYEKDATVWRNDLQTLLQGKMPERKKVDKMRNIREIAEKIGEVKVKYEQANRSILDGKDESEVASCWALHLSILQWVLGDEWTTYPIIALRKEKASEPPQASNISE